jgi:hypothetical protein
VGKEKKKRKREIFREAYNATPDMSEMAATPLLSSPGSRHFKEDGGQTSQ